MRAQPATRAELRLALAMRGGVSLAVWIGGACAEIDAARRSVTAGASEDDAAAIYGSLISAAGFSGVVIDVMSGASAGGLNGAILSSTLAYGVPFDEMRGLWLSLGDIGRLLRSPNERAPLSVLKGDDYFLVQLDSQLRRLITEARSTGRESSLEHLDLFLSATLMNPVEAVISSDPFETIVERRQNAFFHFRHHGWARCLTDFGDDPAVVAHRLAIAGRTTSSFPGAFEPSRITARRPPSLGARPSAAGDMFGIFSETGGAGFDVIDGGVLDNIPVARAIDAIAAAPADSPVERWLLFLHPSPELSVEAPAATERPGALRTVVASLSTKSNQESLLSDMAVLEEHNLRARDYRNLRTDLLPFDAADVSEEARRLWRTGAERMSEPLARVVIGAIDKAGARYSGYRESRGTQAGDVILDLIQDPARYMKHDPFPTRIGQPLKDWTGEERDALRLAISRARQVRLPAAHAGHPRAGLPSRLTEIDGLDLGAVSRVTDVLIEWLSNVQRRVRTDDPAQAGRVDALATLKRGLYDARMLTQELLRYDDYLWALLTFKEPPPRSDQPALDKWAERVFTKATQLLFDQPSDGPAARIVEGLERYLSLAAEAAASDADPRFAAERSEVVRSIAAHVCELEDGIARALDATAPPAGPTMDLRQALWTYLVSVAMQVAKLLWDSPFELADDPVFQVLELAPHDSAVGTTHVIAALEVALFPVTITLARTEPINFRQVAGTSRTPIVRYLPDGTLDVKRKLAGNELANFAAFYKASWRANDWMWGRMDAAKSMVDVLAQPERIRQHFRGSTGGAPADAFKEVVEGLVTRPVALPGGASELERDRWARHFRGVWDSRKGPVGDEIDTLFRQGGHARPLHHLKDVLVERRHWDILLSELPTILTSANEEELGESGTLTVPTHEGGLRGWVRERGRRMRQRLAWLRTRARTFRHGGLAQAAAAIRATGLDPLRDPNGMIELLRRYRVGEETIRGEAGTARFARIAGDLAVVSWNAFAGRSAPGALRPVGWTIKLGRHIARTVVGAPRWALVTMPMLLVGSSYLAIAGREFLGMGRTLWGLVAVAVAGAFVLWMTSLSRLVLFVLLFGGLLYAFTHLSGSFTLSFDGRPLIEGERSEEVVLWIAAALLLLVGGWLFRLVPGVQRRWVGWVAVALGVALAATALTVDPVGDYLLAGGVWALLALIFVVMALPPIYESLHERRRRAEVDAPPTPSSGARTPRP